MSCPWRVSPLGVHLPVSLVPTPTDSQQHNHLLPRSLPQHWAREFFTPPWAVGDTKTTSWPWRLTQTQPAGHQWHRLTALTALMQLKAVMCLHLACFVQVWLTLCAILSCKNYIKQHSPWQYTSVTFMHKRQTQMQFSLVFIVFLWTAYSVSWVKWGLCVHVHLCPFPPVCTVLHQPLVLN